MIPTKLKLLQRSDNVVIGNTVEAVMFAMLNNYDYIHSSIRAYRWFESYPFLGNLFDLNSLYSSLYLFWRMAGGTLYDFSDKRIEFRADKVLEVRLDGLDSSFYLKYDKCHLFDDFNIFNIPGVLTEARKYRVYDTITSRQFVDIIDEPVIIKTGQHFPSLVCLASNEMRREIAMGYETFSEKETNYQKYTYNVCMAYSELTREELRKVDNFQSKNLRFFMQDFMRHFGGTTKTMAFPIRQIESTVGSYECWHDHVIVYSDKNQLLEIWDSFWRSFFDTDSFAHLPIVEFRKQFQIKHLVHDFLRKSGLQITAGRIGKKDDTEASSKISEVIIRSAKPDESA
jgi:hypothetical protein